MKPKTKAVQAMIRRLGRIRASDTDPPIERYVAAIMEEALVWATQDMVGWNLPKAVKSWAQILKETKCTRNRERNECAKENQRDRLVGHD